MKKIFYYFLIAGIQIFAQPDFKIDPDVIKIGKFFNSEIHYFPASNNYSVYYSYKISYSQLFFEKKGDYFKAGLRVGIEIKDSLGNTIERGFDDQEVSLKDFQKTNSVKDYLQGVIELKVPQGNFNFYTTIADKISKRERRIPSIDINIDKSSLILSPMVIESNRVNCDGTEAFVLSNFSSSIPFNKPGSELFIPITDTSISSISYTIKNDKKVLVENDTISDYKLLDSKLVLCNSLISITEKSTSGNIKYFRIKNLSANLFEGPIKLEVIINENIKKIFPLNVIWIGKPNSLTQPEEAIKLLDVIETKEIVSDLLSKSGDHYENLIGYWSLKDPTPATKFNELMSEFYSRADYCELNFNTLTGNGGIRSDRGKIYIKFGAPDLIERNTNADDIIVESWIYNKLNKRFLFMDSDGTGKFNLAEGQ